MLQHGTGKRLRTDNLEAECGTLGLVVFLVHPACPRVQPRSRAAGNWIVLPRRHRRSSAVAAADLTGPWQVIARLLTSTSVSLV